MISLSILPAGGRLRATVDGAEGRDSIDLAGHGYTSITFETGGIASADAAGLHLAEASAGKLVVAPGEIVVFTGVEDIIF